MDDMKQQKCKNKQDSAITNKSDLQSTCNSSFALFKNCVKKISIPHEKKIKQKDYLSQGTIPVIDQGETFIGGYTNDANTILKCPFPVIVFGDHTKTIKLVNFDFAPGADGIKVLKPTEQYDIRFFFYAMQYVTGKMQDRGYSRNYQYLEKELIPTFSLPEQKRIVEKIDELFSDLDAAESELQIAKEKLEKYRTIIIDSIFSKCTTRKLNTLCDVITDGDHQPPPKSESGVPFIMISNIEGNVINWENTAFVDLKYYQGIGEKRTPKKGDILYTVTGSFGIPVSVDFERKFCFQRHIALLRPIKSVQHKFLFYALQTSGVFTQAVEQSTGTAQKTVGLGVLRNFNVPFTESQKDQESIINEIDFFLNGHRKIEQTIERALRQCCNLRHSVLTQAFEGDLA